MLILNVMNASNLFQKSWDRSNIRLEKMCNANKTGL